MPTLGLNNFNIVCSTLGGFVALFGLVSFLAKDRFYLSEARTSLTCGRHYQASLLLLIVDHSNISSGRRLIWACSKMDSPRGVRPE